MNKKENSMSKFLLLVAALLIVVACNRPEQAPTAPVETTPAPQQMDPGHDHNHSEDEATTEGGEGTY
jgi:uncharacterized lipoprotein YajG